MTSLAAHPLRFRDYRFYLSARLCAVLAQEAMVIILGWQTYNFARLTMTTSGAAAQLGLIGLMQFLPVFFLTPLSGWVADRFDRRRVASVALLCNVASAATLALATFHHTISLPLIFAIAATTGAARAFMGPSMSSLAPNLVPRESLPRAIAVASIAWQSASIIGPALGGYLYGFRPWGAYAVAATLFFVALVAMNFIKPVAQTSVDRARHPIRQMIDGLSYVRTNRLVLGAITLDLVAVMLAGVTAILPIYARDIYHAGPTDLGHLAAASGVGAGLTALWFSFHPPRENVGNKMLGSVVVFGMSIILFGLTAYMPPAIGLPVGLFALAISGVSDMFSVFVRQSLIQMYTPDAMRGRVSSVSLLTISASNELGATESGFLSALVGPIAATIIGGTGAIVAAVLWSRWFPELGLARSFDTSNIATQSHQKEEPA
jgi:MFS family permease